jgi:hypothetical protein
MQFQKSLPWSHHHNVSIGHQLDVIQQQRQALGTTYLPLNPNIYV